MSEVSGWGFATALAAPVVIVGGWTWAARDVPGYDGLRQTISSLGVPGAPNRHVVTGALAVLGACYAGTAVALRGVPRPARVVLGVAGALTSVVAAFPQPAHGEPAVPEHTYLAGAAFAGLAFWPLLGLRPDGPAVLQPRVAVPAVAVMTVEAAAFTALIGRPERFEGLVERVLAVTQACWPLVVALGLRRR